MTSTAISAQAEDGCGFASVTQGNSWVFGPRHRYQHSTVILVYVSIYGRVPPVDDCGSASGHNGARWPLLGVRCARTEWHRIGCAALHHVAYLISFHLIEGLDVERQLPPMMAFPEPVPVDAMPMFTVLTPHYSKKILLLLHEIIHEEDQMMYVMLLKYLEQLHPVEWANFVKDTKILAEEWNVYLI